MEEMCFKKLQQAKKLDKGKGASQPWAATRRLGRKAARIRGEAGVPVLIGMGWGEDQLPC